MKIGNNDFDQIWLKYATQNVLVGISQIKRVVRRLSVKY